MAAASIPDLQIQCLDHRRAEWARAIRDLLQLAYRREAQIVGAADFPPLRRTVADIRTSGNAFYGFPVGDEELAATLELHSGEGEGHIVALGVRPDHFRQGLATALVRHVMGVVPTVRVATAAGNGPAIRLYEGLGFARVGDYDTPERIRMTRLVHQR